MGLYGPYTTGDDWVRLSIGFASETNTRVDLVDAAPVSWRSFQSACGRQKRYLVKIINYGIVFVATVSGLQPKQLFSNLP